MLVVSIACLRKWEEWSYCRADVLLFGNVSDLLLFCRVAMALDELIIMGCLLSGLVQKLALN
jgi:hypothetical protein